MSERRDDIKLMHNVIQTTLFSSLLLSSLMQEDLNFDASIQEDLERIRQKLDANTPNLFDVWNKLSSLLHQIII